MENITLSLEFDAIVTKFWTGMWAVKLWWYYCIFSMLLLGKNAKYDATRYWKNQEPKPKITGNGYTNSMKTLQGSVN